MARRYDSEAARKRILSASVRLFLERGYHGTTMAAILREADVSSSTFQNIFGTKDGVLFELLKLMFSGQVLCGGRCGGAAGTECEPCLCICVRNVGSTYHR